MGKQILIDGKPLAWWLYPSRRWSGTIRRRTLAYLQPPDAGRAGHLVDEQGVVTLIPHEGAYDALRVRILEGRGGVTVYVPQRTSGTDWWQTLMLDAVNDKRAMMSYAPSCGLRGIRWKNRGRGRGGALLLDRAWGEERYGLQPADWLAGIRRTLDFVGIGDYDTSGSLGEATLSKFWTESGHRHEWRVGTRMSDLIRRYTIGGRAEAPGAREAPYPYAWEIDLNHAYPTAVARGLPFGLRYYASRDVYTRLPRAAAGYEARFGEWRIRVHEDIPFSPIPLRDNWNVKGGRLLWSLPAGIEITYAGWEEEIAALLDTGAVSVEWQRGWVWPRLDSFLAPWVDSLYARRDEAPDPFVHAMVKQTALSAIGMWGLGDPAWEVVPTSEADDMDLPIEIPVGGEPSLGVSGLWLHKVSDEPRVARPIHWASYVRAMVRIELWHTLMRELRAGNQVISSNFDSLLLEEPPHAYTQGTNRAATCAAQEEHPWEWKTVPHLRTIVPYNRSVLFPDEERWQTPGMSPAMRMAILVDHQRRRQAEEVSA